MSVTLIHTYVRHYLILQIFKDLPRYRLVLVWGLFYNIYIVKLKSEKIFLYLYFFVSLNTLVM